MDTHTAVAYIPPPTRKHHAPLASGQHVHTQRQKIENHQNTFNLPHIDYFVEVGDLHYGRHDFPALSEAIHACIQNQGDLIISQLGNLLSNTQFVQLVEQYLQKSSPNARLICLDQPSINKANFRILAQHAKERSQTHAKLIKQGIERSDAKSGNPHAREMIDEINRGKKYSAMVFALYLQPLIEQFIQQNYTQREMVDELNELKFTAPLGGTWVLSQLQKYLDKIKLTQQACLSGEPTLFQPIIDLNQALLSQKDFLLACHRDHLTEEQLNALMPSENPKIFLRHIESLLELSQRIEENFLTNPHYASFLQTSHFKHPPVKQLHDQITELARIAAVHLRTDYRLKP